MADDLPPGADASTLTAISPASDLPPGADASTLTAIAPAASKESWSDWGRRIYGGVENALHREAVATDPWPVMHDMGAGAIRQVAGAAEIIPGVQPYALAVEDKIKDPQNAAGTVGDLIPWVVGGEFLGAGKLASLVPEASKAPGILNAAGRIASPAAKGTIGGGVVGAESGAATPTGKADYTEAMKEKAKLAGAKGLIGASIGAGVGGAVGIAPEAYGLYQTAAKKPANAAAEDFRKWASGEGVSAASAEEAKALDAGKTATETQADIAKREADLAKTHAERGAMTEQAIDASETTKKLIEGFKAGAKTSDVELGGQVQKIVDETVEKLEGEREKAAGFEKALADAGDEPRVSTQSVLDYIRTWKARESDTIGAVLDKFERQLSKPLSIYQANALRKEINAAMRTKRLRLENSDLAVDASTLHHLNEIQKLLNGEAKQAWPPYAQALEKHAEMSRPLDPYYHEGPLKGLATTGEFSGNYKMLPGQVVAQIMQKSAKGAEAFKELMARDPSVKDSVRQYLRWKLAGESGAREVTPKMLRTFLDNNQEVLEQTGLLDEFKGLSSAISGSEAAASSAQSAVERLATEAKVKAGDLDAVKSTLKEAEKAGTLAAENRAKYEKLLDNLSAAKPEKVVGEARALVDKLTDDGHIPREARQKALEQINEIEQKYQDAASARRALLAVSGFLILSSGAGYADYWLGRGVLHAAVGGGHH